MKRNLLLVILSITAAVVSGFSIGELHDDFVAHQPIDHPEQEEHLPDERLLEENLPGGSLPEDNGFGTSRHQLPGGHPMEGGHGCLLQKLKEAVKESGRLPNLPQGSNETCRKIMMCVWERGLIQSLFAGVAEEVSRGILECARKGNLLENLQDGTELDIYQRLMISIQQISQSENTLTGAFGDCADAGMPNWPMGPDSGFDTGTGSFRGQMPDGHPTGSGFHHLLEQFKEAVRDSGLLHNLTQGSDEVGRKLDMCFAENGLIRFFFEGAVDNVAQGIQDCARSVGLLSSLSGDAEFDIYQRLLKSVQGMIPPENERQLRFRQGKGIGRNKNQLGKSGNIAAGFDETVESNEGADRNESIEPEGESTNHETQQARKEEYMRFGKGKGRNNKLIEKIRNTTAVFDDTFDSNEEADENKSVEPEGESANLGTQPAGKEERMRFGKGKGNINTPSGKGGNIATPFDETVDSNEEADENESVEPEGESVNPETQQAGKEEHIKFGKGKGNINTPSGKGGNIATPFDETVDSNEEADENESVEPEGESVNPETQQAGMEEHIKFGKGKGNINTPFGKGGNIATPFDETVNSNEEVDENESVEPEGESANLETQPAGKEEHMRFGKGKGNINTPFGKGGNIATPFDETVDGNEEEDEKESVEPEGESAYLETQQAGKEEHMRFGKGKGNINTPSGKGGNIATPFDETVDSNEEADEKESVEPEGESAYLETQQAGKEEHMRFGKGANPETQPGGKEEHMRFGKGKGKGRNN